MLSLSLFLLFREASVIASALLSSPSRCLVLSCLFLLPLGSFIFFCFDSAASFLRLFSLLSFHSALEVCFLFFAVCSALLCLRYTLRCPFFAAVPLPYASSRFPVSLLACSVMLPHLPGIVFIAFCVFTSVSSFSPVRLLRLGFRSLYLLVGCFDVSSPPVAVLF